jgi:uncharacterized membrane protein
MSSPGRRGKIHRRAVTVLWLAAAACSDPAVENPLPDPGSSQCRESTLTYQNFAAPFVISWCRGCHGSAQPVSMRQNAPVGVDFDTAEQVRTARDRILARATGASPTMPPVGGPSVEERLLLAEWLACGMK